MTRPVALLAACLLLTACPAPPPAGVPAGGASAAPSAAPAGPPIANPGAFTFAAGQSTRYRRTEATAAGPVVQLLTLTIEKIENGFAAFKLASRPEAGGASQDRTGDFAVAGGDPYWLVVDPNLRNGEVKAVAKAEGEEAVTVPAGHYTCTRTRYQKDLTPAIKLDVTTWTNGTVGLVKAQVANVLTAAGASQTSDVRIELVGMP